MADSKKKNTAKKSEREANNPDPRYAEGTPPKVGEEGGVIAEGTGDFAPGATDGDTTGGSGRDTVKVQTREGRVVEVEVGIDGENPVSPQNPPKKAAIGVGSTGTVVGGEDNPTEAADRNEGTSGDRVDEDAIPED